MGATMQPNIYLHAAGPILRRVEGPPTAKSIEDARAAGAKEAAEATAMTGVDYTAAYERMCRLLADL